MENVDLMIMDARTESLGSGHVHTTLQNFQVKKQNMVFFVAYLYLSNILTRIQM